MRSEEQWLILSILKLEISKFGLLIRYDYIQCVVWKVVYIFEINVLIVLFREFIYCIIFSNFARISIDGIDFIKNIFYKIWSFKIFSNILFFFFGKKELYFYDKFVGKIDTCQVSSVLINNGRKVFPINSMMEVK